MATKLAYLEDFDVISCEANIVGVEKTDDDRVVLVLDQTCFYPRGGGQDWDTGRISSDGVEFVVDEVRLDEQGIVHHSGHFNGGEFAAGHTVRCAVDAERRSINTKLHSAGHLLDMSMYELYPDWTPGRGAHYPHMSFVEYQVPEGTAIEDTFAQRLQAKVVEQQQTTIDNEIRFMPKAEMARYCRHVPDNIPANKPSRIVIYANSFGSPCGGTHVKHLTDIGTITITKAKIKQGIAKISYGVANIN